jgi:hypothetical protein
MIWRTVLLLPSCECIVEMIARKVEEVANDRVAFWTRGETVVSSFGYPINPKSYEDSRYERKDKIGWHRERSSRPETVRGEPSLRRSLTQALGV